MDLRRRGVQVHVAGPQKRLDWQYVGKIGEAIHSFRPDTISLHLLSASLHGRIACLRWRHHANPRVVTALHNSLWETLRHSPGWPRKAITALYILADAILARLTRTVHVAVGEDEADDLRRRSRARRVVLIRNTLPRVWPPDWETIERERDRLKNLAGEAVLIGLFCRLEEQKGVDLAYDAISALGAPAVLVIAGEGTLQPPESVPSINLGRLHEVGAAMGACDIVLAPSRWEAFGRTALEALSLGVPVVHSGRGGLAALHAAAPPGLSHPVGSLTGKALATALAHVLASAPAFAESRFTATEGFRRDWGFQRAVHEWTDAWSGRTART